MSLIGTFGLCPEEAWEELVCLAAAGQMDRARASIEKICGTLRPALVREEETCSGEVFPALFAYCKTALGEELWEKSRNIQALWRENTGDYAVAVFPAAERERLLTLTERVRAAELEVFVSDFFQMDCGGAGQAALETFRRGLRAQTPETVLIFRIY